MRLSNGRFGAEVHIRDHSLNSGLFLKTALGLLWHQGPQYVLFCRSITNIRTAAHGTNRKFIA